jgi:hypothetical protein
MPEKIAESEELRAKGGQSEGKPINKIQVQLIHIGKAQLGLSDEAYRLVLNQLFWVNTCKDLNYDEATKLIEHFKSKGFKIVTKKYSRGQGFKGSRSRAENIIQLASPQKLAMIEHLRADIRWHVHDGYFRWLKKWLKKDRIATNKDANSVIEGLKGMLSRQQRAKSKELRAESIEQRATPTHPSPLEGEGKGEGESLRRDGGLHGGRWQW